MCLTTNDPTIKVATEDIFVFKECSEIDKNYAKVSVAKEDFTYEAGKATEKVHLKPIEYIGYFEVNEGYHSHNFPTKYADGLFVIPKGTEYIDGWFNSTPSLLNRVSSSLIFVKPKRYGVIGRYLIKIGLKKF